MAKFTVILERKTTNRINNDSLKSQIEFIVSRSIHGGNRKSWGWENVLYKPSGPTNDGSQYLYKVNLEFERKKQTTPDKLNSELSVINEFLTKTCTSAKFKPAWSISKLTADWNKNFSTETVENHTDVVDFERALTLDQIKIPDVLIYGSDSEIESHDAFKGIYGRAKHIRIIASSIKRMIVTKGEKRNHILLYGLPGCAKSHILMGWMKILGSGGYFTINANSATKPGIEKMFLTRFKETGVPPICFIEEIEKTAESVLSVWLSVLDDRAEVRKINFVNQEKTEAKVLSIATANDKILFDRLHGGRPGFPGALSSRFTKQLYLPRPDKDILRRILLRDVQLYGGKASWVEPCLDIAQELGTNDPRIVLSLLDGQDRLLDNSYKDDIVGVFKAEENDVWKAEENDEE